MTHRESILDNLIFHDYEPQKADIAREVLTGLRQEQPSLHPKFFYDARGSELFEAITRQPEYYLTDTEKVLLRKIAPDLPGLLAADALLAEPGAGNCEKARLLLDYWQPRGYMPIEISRDELQRAARDLALEKPGLAIHAVCADYTRQIAWPDETPAPRLVFFPGSTLGNFEPGERAPFMRRMRELAGEGGHLLLGADLHKDSAVLNAAYNDAAGYTAAFNLNMLHHLNDLLGAGFEPEHFAHEAFYNEPLRRVEMHLHCQQDQRITIDGEHLELKAGSSIHTENSYKFTREELEGLLGEAGFVMRHWWEASDPGFGLFLAETV